MANQFDLLTLHSGDLWSFNLSFPEYPLADNDIEIQLNKPGFASTKIIAKSETDSLLLFEYNSAALNNHNGGNYIYRIIAVNKETKKVYTLESGGIEIKPNYLKGDARSYWQRILDNAKEAYEALSKKTVSSYSFEGRDFTYQDLPTLRKIINQAEQEIKKENGERTGVQYHQVRLIN